MNDFSINGANNALNDIGVGAAEEAFFAQMASDEISLYQECESKEALEDAERRIIRRREQLDTVSLQRLPKLAWDPDGILDMFETLGIAL